MRSFFAKPCASLTEKDFVECSVWACYDEPEDIDALNDLGFERAEISNFLEAIAYADDYAFALPPEAAGASFNDMYRSVRATARGGTQPVGYVTGPCR